MIRHQGEILYIVIAVYVLYRSLVPSPSPLPASQTRDRSSQHTLQADRQYAVCFF